MSKTCRNCEYCKEVLTDDIKRYYCVRFEVKICDDLVNQDNDCDDYMNKEE